MGFFYFTMGRCWLTRWKSLDWKDSRSMACGRNPMRIQGTAPFDSLSVCDDVAFPLRLMTGWKRRRSFRITCIGNERSVGRDVWT
jgi:ABC-type transporter Mla maintaining outer membrane lipid asymmetry ATPase subunit MlaF